MPPLRLRAWPPLVLSLLLLLLSCACGGSKEKCDSFNLCSCDVKETDGFCVDLHNEADFTEADCLILGGRLRAEDCPTDDLFGVCREIDDCHDPHYYFYDNYAGALAGADTLEELEFACEEGEFVGSTCASWTSSE